jgi:hypothetical protein
VVAEEPPLRVIAVPPLAAIVACIEARLAAWLSAIAFITFVL